MIPTFFGTTIIFFYILQVVPGGPFETAVMQLKMQQISSGESGSGPAQESGTNSQLTQKMLEDLRIQYGLDKPIMVRYLIWMGLWPREDKVKAGAELYTEFRENVEKIEISDSESYYLQRWVYIEEEFVDCDTTSDGSKICEGDEGWEDSLGNDIWDPNTEEGKLVIYESKPGFDFAFSIPDNISNEKKNYIENYLNNYKELPEADDLFDYEGYMIKDSWIESKDWKVNDYDIESGSIRLTQHKRKGILSGYLGYSRVHDQDVSTLIWDRIHISAYFGIIGFILSYLICVPLGIFKAIWHGSKFDILSSATVFIGYSVPAYALGVLMLVYLTGDDGFFPMHGFSSDSWVAEEFTDLNGNEVWDGQCIGINDSEIVTSGGPVFLNEKSCTDEGHKWNPEEFNDLNGDGTYNEKFTFFDKVFDILHHTALPLICWVIGSFATLTVLMKNSLLHNLNEDYVRTAFAKGLSERRVIFFHAVRNSLIPIATGIGGIIGIFFAGSYLIEKVFDIDGIGLLSYNALLTSDFDIVLGFLIIGTITRLVGNLISDITYALIDPRIRFS